MDGAIGRCLQIGSTPMASRCFFDEGNHVLDRRSSSAWAKYADALRRISLACFNSRLSRSSAFIFSAISVVMPTRSPRSALVH